MSILFFVLLFQFCVADIKGPVRFGFYPSDKTELLKLINSYIEKARIPKFEGEIVGVISPHAGYIYSGPVAAYNYKILKHKKIDTVVLLGHSHVKPLRKAALYKDGKIITPLGTVEVDHVLTDEILKNKDLFYVDRFAHENDHVLDVQIPFLQTVLKDFKVVLIMLSDFDMDTYKAVAEQISRCIKKLKRKVIVVISADMSHYPSYNDAYKVDKIVTDAILKFDPVLVKRKVDETMRLGIRNLECSTCSEGSILTGMYLCKMLGANKVQLLKLANSGDVGPDRSSVVGYLSCVFLKPIKKTEVKMEEFTISEENKKFLIKLARDTLKEYLKTGEIPKVDVKDKQLLEPAAVFVTLNKHGDLRGCIGTTTPQEPLYKAVQKYVIESAIRDPRFPPVTKEELKDIKIEISILSPLRRVKTADEIEPNIHGVMVRKGVQGGLYLPQVWEHFTKKEDFLRSLCLHKAGLRPDAWKSPDTELYVFTVVKLKEE